MVHGTAEHMGQRWSAGSRRRVRERSQSAAAMRWNSPIRNTGKERAGRERATWWVDPFGYHTTGRAHHGACDDVVSVSRCGKRALGPVGKCRYHIPNRLGRPSTSASPDSSSAACSALLFLWRLLPPPPARRARLGELLRRLARGRGESQTSSRSPRLREPCTRGTCVASVRAARRLRHRTCSPEPREL